jgi:hypothetical protein
MPSLFVPPNRSRIKLKGVFWNSLPQFYLGRYSSLAYSGHGVCFCCLFLSPFYLNVAARISLWSWIFFPPRPSPSKSSFLVSLKLISRSTGYVSSRRLLVRTKVLHTNKIKFKEEKWNPTEDTQYITSTLSLRVWWALYSLPSLI